MQHCPGSVYEIQVINTEVWRTPCEGISKLPKFPIGDNFEERYVQG